MFRAEADIARFVLALMVIAKRLTTGFCGFLVEPATRKDAPRRLNPQHRRARPLIGDDVNLETGILKMVLVGLADRPMMGIAVMRQHQERLWSGLFSLSCIKVRLVQIKTPLEMSVWANRREDTGTRRVS